MTGVWETTGFEHRQRELRHSGLRSLYPSQSWSLYRIVPQCDSVIDFGFGSVDSMVTLRSINPEIRYTGLDSSARVVGAASAHADERTTFLHVDFSAFSGTADLTQGWLFVYAHDRPYEAIRKLYECSTRFCLFDVRATHLSHDVIDPSRSYASHDDERVVYPLLSWKQLLGFLSSLEPPPAIEFATYYWPPSDFVTISSTLPQPFVVSVVLIKGVQPSLFGRLVPPLPA